MHAEAFEYVKWFATDEPIHVIEIGSRNVNGSVRNLFPNAHYVGIDIEDGEGVDVVVDALEYEPEGPVDLVIICEVLEHESRWMEMINVASGWLNETGKMLITVAGPNRKPHSAFDGGELRPGEYYANVSEDDLFGVLRCAGLGCDVREGRDGQDVYAFGYIR